MDYGRLCEDSDVWGCDGGFGVQAFLSFIGSPRVKDVAAFAGWVQEASAKFDINPRMLLAIAQKEQSFLTRPGSGSGWQRALDWTMGYGATDSGDLPRYAGTQNQVLSAAAGLRRYRGSGRTAAMVGKPLGRTMPDIRDELTRQVVPQNQATAALYLYTPHRSGAEGFAGVWAWLKEREKAMAAAGGTAGPAPAGSGATSGDAGGDGSARARALAIAKRVAKAREDGLAKLVVGNVTFHPGETGYCARFVRQVHEAALGLPEFTWPFGAASARDMEKKLKAAGRQVAANQRQPGDVVALNRLWAGVYGHVALYVGRDATGQDLVAEDGSHGIAVDPIGSRAWHISGWYAALPADDGAGDYSDGPVKIVLLPASTVLDCDAAMEAGRARCDLRPLAEALAAEVFDHVADQRKVYVRPATVTAAEMATVAPKEDGSEPATEAAGRASADGA